MAWPAVGATFVVLALGAAGATLSDGIGSAIDSASAGDSYRNVFVDDDDMASAYADLFGSDLYLDLIASESPTRAPFENRDPFLGHVSDESAAQDGGHLWAAQPPESAWPAAAALPDPEGECAPQPIVEPVTKDKAALVAASPQYEYDLSELTAWSSCLLLETEDIIPQDEDVPISETAAAIPEAIPSRSCSPVITLQSSQSPASSSDIAMIESDRPRLGCTPRHSSANFWSMRVQQLIAADAASVQRRLPEVHVLERSSQRSSKCSNHIPLLPLYCYADMKLVAAHFWKHFRLTATTPAASSTSLYQRSLVCRLFCYYVHFGADDADFNREHGAKLPCSFFARCRPVMPCRPNVLRSDSESEAFVAAAHDPASEDGAANPRLKHEDVLDLIRRHVRGLGDRLEEVAQFEVAAPLPRSGKPHRAALLPRLRPDVRHNMAVVATHFYRHFGPLPMLNDDRLVDSDRHYRRSLSRRIICYYAHCQGSDEAFLLRHPNLPFECFFEYCSGRIRCDSERRYVLRHDRFRSRRARAQLAKTTT